MSPALAGRFLSTAPPGKSKSSYSESRSSGELPCFHANLHSLVQLTVAPLSLGFPSQEYWSGLPCPPGDLPNPGTEPTSPASPALQAGSLPLSHQGTAIALACK